MLLSLVTISFKYICVIEWMSGGEGRTSNIIPSLSSCFSCSPTLAWNGSEGIVCLWFSFERVWSFFSWSLKNSLSIDEERKNYFVRGNARKPTRTFIPKRCVLRQTTCLLFHVQFLFRFCHSIFGFPIFFSSFTTSRRRIRIDCNPIWFLIFYELRILMETSYLLTSQRFLKNIDGKTTVVIFYQRSSWGWLSLGEDFFPFSQYFFFHFLTSCSLSWILSK